MSTLSRVGELARRHDPDRFFTTLFAPAAARPALWALYAFNHELARAQEGVREPMMAAIRLQWWREVVEGHAKRHEVATPLQEALNRGALRAQDLLELIDAREDSPEADGDWPDYADRTAGQLAVAAAYALGEERDPTVRAAGATFGAAGILRNRALSGQAPLPELRDAGLSWLRAVRAGRLTRAALPAALPAAFAARDLARVTPVRHRDFGDKLAVLRAAFTHRV